MNATRALSALAGRAARSPRAVLAVALSLGVAGAVLALGLRPTAATSTLVSSSSPQYRATQRYYRSFGEEPILVLVKGNLQQLVLSSDLERLLGLEGCLSGKVPSSALAAEGGAGGPCGQLSRAHTVKVVFGPGTFLDEAAEQIDAQLTAQTRQAQTQADRAASLVQRAALARGLGSEQANALATQARKVSLAGFQSNLVSLALQYGLTSRPSLENTNFVSDVVFDPSKPAGTPRARFAYLFPSPDAALVSIRLKPGLSEAARRQTITWIRQAVRMPQWHLSHGESYLVTGEPVIVADLSSSISHSIELLLLAVMLVMAATLALVFAGRPRLLPLALAALAAALLFGAIALAGSSLTMASIAVLPVLVGLAVDYAIQFQSRIQEEREDAPGEPAALVARAAAKGAPTIATAGLASAAAMLVLLLSPVPMVRGFGVLLVLGIAISLVCALTAGAAACSLYLRRSETRSPPARSSALASSSLAMAWRGARELVRDNALTRAFSRAALPGALRHPARVLAVGAALAVLGWGLDTQTSVQTDITKLVPQNLASLRALQTVERVTGVGGEIELVIEGRHLADTKTIEWMLAYQRKVLALAGYSAAHGCTHAQLCPAFSLTDLFDAQSAGGTRAPRLDQSEISGLLAAIPPYFSQDVITANRHVAALSFGIRLMSLSRQQHLIESMHASLHPPAGVHASLVGLSVLAAQSGSQLASPWRRLETLLAGLAAIALVLLLAFRGDIRRVLVPLVPVALASGWSALILFALRVPLNPLSVTLGVLVIAISTEFSVLLAERHRQELLAGHGTEEALRRSYRRTGAAVAASGTTAILGFAVLAFSDIAMLRDFGLVTLVDLSVSLVGVLLALPATLVLADRIAARRASRGTRRTEGAAGHAWAGP